jgi:hypothetical protein
MLPEEAVMVTVPLATPVTNPELLTVALAVLEDVQVTMLLTSTLSPFASTPFAVS